MRYWFKRKRYGWGWTPATKEGWSITLLYLVVALAVAIRFEYLIQTSPLACSIFFLLWAVTLILICYKTGEKPKWQWG